MLLKTTLALASMALGVFAQASQNSIFDLLKTNAGQFAALLSGSPQYQDLVSKLSSNGSNGTYTVFAPNDAAITKTVQGIGASLDLNNILLYHVINGTYSSNNFTSSPTILSTLLTNNTVDFYPNNIGLPVVVKTNGSLVQVLYGFGVANVTQADQRASNGVLHIIDTVLTPPVSPSKTIAAGGLDSLYNALNSTNSTNTLDSKHGITVFAPDNDAFRAADNIKGLNASQIQNILGYHVVDGIYYSTNLSAINNPVNLTTEQGNNITVNNRNGVIQITDMSGSETAKVVKSDILTNNGVLHLIDTVLIPSQNNSIPNNTNNNFTKPTGAASSLRGADFSAAAVLIIAVAAALTITL